MKKLAVAALLLSACAAPRETERAAPREAALLELDVVVTDENGRPLTDLAADDFEVFEHGQVQRITHFARGFAAQPPPSTPRRSGPASFPDDSRSRHFVFVVDDYHMEPEALGPVNVALHRFLDGALGPGDDVAVVLASEGPDALLRLTTDRGLLPQAVDRLRLDAPLGPPPPYPWRLTEYQARLIDRGDTEALQLALEENKATEPRHPLIAIGSKWKEAQVRSRVDQIMDSTARVTSLTLASVESLVRALHPLRGRKVVTLFSSGFFLGGGRYIHELDLNRIADAAVVAGAVVHTVEARGPAASPAIAAAGIASGKNGTTAVGARGRIEQQAIEKARDGPSRLAEKTGGLALFDGDIGGALQRILEDSGISYRLGYRPQSLGPDTWFRRIVIRVPTRFSRLRVRTASGYFRQAPASVDTLETRETPGEEAASLLRIALDSTVHRRDLSLSMSADFVATSAGDFVVATTWIDTFRARSDGRKAATFDLVGVVVDETGRTLGQFSDRVALALAPEPPELAAVRGRVAIEPVTEGRYLRYRKSVAVHPGLLEVRVVMRDDASGLLGTATRWIEVPDRARQPLALSSVMAKSEDIGPLAQVGARASVSFDRPDWRAVFASGYQVFDGKRWRSRWSETRGTDFARSVPGWGYLDYKVLAYSPTKAETGSSPSLLVERQLLIGSRVVAKEPPRPVPPEDPADVQAITGRLRLDSLTLGAKYELRLVVTDRRHPKATATRSLHFSVGTFPWRPTS